MIASARHPMEKGWALAVAGFCAMLLGSCAAPQQAAPPSRVVTVQPAPPPPPPPPQPADWRDAPASPGSWYWRKEGNRSIAFYGDPKMPSYGGFWLVCDTSVRQIELRFTSPKLDDTMMTVVTTSTQRVLKARRSGAEVVATLPASDPLLDAMAFSRGRFMVTVLHDTPRYLPAWPEVSRVVEDCR